MRRIEREHYQYLFSNKIEPVASLRVGETAVVETEDAFSGRLQSPEDFQRPELIDPHYANPVTGPIYIEGAEIGDVLEVRIDDIRCHQRGATLHRPGFGGLPHRFAEALGRFVDIADDEVLFNDRIRLPLNPLIGTIGIAPEVEAVLSVTPGSHGGNLDCRYIGAGSSFYVPVRNKGAYLFLGDVHAVQGDAEICGVAIEVRAEVTLTPFLHRGRWNSIKEPRVKTPDVLVTIASDKPLEVALQKAFAEMIGWMEEEFDFDPSEAYLFLSQAGDARVCQVVNPMYTMACVVPRRYLGR